ncbi:MAG: cell division protein ZapA [Bacteroidales bacterium]|jgi:cell division protein ZapA (FtsZ GTPase activity inhibitor)
MSIVINILGRTYPINVDEENEANILQAEKELMNIINSMKKSYAYNDDKDLLAMSALQFATKAILYENLLKDKDKSLKDIVEKVKELDSLFNKEVL